MVFQYGGAQELIAIWEMYGDRQTVDPGLGVVVADVMVQFARVL